MGELFEKIYDFDNLMKAFKKSALCRHHKKDVIKFELYLPYFIWKLHYKLKSGNYVPMHYNKFVIFEPKKREIQALSFADRVVQTSICQNAVRDYIDKRLIYDCAACRPNKGTHFAINRMNKFLRKFYKCYKTDGYFLKIDVKKYFENINHTVLKSMLVNFPDKEVLELLYRIIDSYNYDTDKGLPMGNQTSQWFALLYLNRLDRLIKEKMQIKFYSRYMDDLVLLHHSKKYLQECLKTLRDVATNELKLEFNQKTQIFPVSHGIDYLGFRFFLSDTGKVVRMLRNSNKKRFKRRIKSFVKKYKTGEIDLLSIYRSLQSYSGHLKHGHTYRLKQHVYKKLILSSNYTITPPID